MRETELLGVNRFCAGEQPSYRTWRVKVTTRIHVVNLGSDAVIVTPSNNSPESVLYPGDSVNEYVYEGRNVLVKEKKADEPKRSSNV